MSSLGGISCGLRISSVGIAASGPVLVPNQLAGHDAIVDVVIADIVVDDHSFAAP